MASNSNVSASNAQTALATNNVLRNTYLLLSMTLLFSAAIAGATMALGLNDSPSLIIMLVGYFGLLFATMKTANSGWGLVSVFALTGFMGYTLGPIIDAYLHQFVNGGQIVMLSLGGTGTIFVGLSAYALASGRRFNQWAGMLFVGILVAFAMGLIAAIFSIPALSLAVSFMFLLLMSGLIVYQTGEIVHGGETNYILATVTLFVSIYNLFLVLLQLLGFFMGED